MSLTEDRRAAANVAVSLSSQLMAAALTMLTILGAFLVFVLDRRSAGIWFTTFAIFSFVLFVCVIVVGGRGIAGLYRSVAEGSWNPDDSKAVFNRQSLFAVGALICFATTVALSFGLEERPDGTQAHSRSAGTIPPIVKAIAESVAVHRSSVVFDSLRQLREQVQGLSRTLDSLRVQSSARVDFGRETKKRSPR